MWSDVSPSSLEISKCFAEVRVTESGPVERDPAPGPAASVKTARLPFDISPTFGAAHLTSVIVRRNAPPQGRSRGFLRLLATLQNRSTSCIFDHEGVSGAVRT